MNAPPPVTLRVVAKKAKVALATASKSLNGDPSVRDYLRERVLRVAASLGYRINPLARAMATRSTNLVTLSVFELENPFYGRLADRLTHELAAIGMGSVFCARTDQVVAFNTGFCAAGSILISPTADDVNQIAAQHPVVTIQSQQPSEQQAPDVALDIDGAYRELTRRVLASGRLRIACHSVRQASDWRGKFATVKAAAAAAGHATIDLPDAILESPEALAQLLRERPGTVDALFTRNDLEAAKLLTVLHAAGVRVPEDVLLIGSDGMIPLPGVWTATADIAGMATSAVAMLKRSIDGDSSKRCEVLQLPLRTPGWSA
jgi:DNA-binding LacI/PurR family transcriptional regulator